MSEVCNHECGECEYYMQPFCTYTPKQEPRYTNRIDKNNIKFNTLNPVWDNTKEDALNVFEMIEIMNNQHFKIDKLERVTRTALWELNRIDEYENYSLHGNWGNFTLHSIKEGKMILTPLMVVERLNKLSKQNQLLKLKNKNALKVLDDFMNVLNEIQADPNQCGGYYLNKARDMLELMGKEVKPNLDEIRGDSKGKEAALKIAEWMTKNCKYEYYKPEFKPEFKPMGINCSQREPTDYKKRKAIEKALKELKNG